jgi:hypothetical protein
MFVYKDTINPALKSILLQKALENWNNKLTVFESGGELGGVRGYINVQEHFGQDVVKMCNQEIKKIMYNLGLKDEEFAYCRHFIGVNTPGAFVSPHIDNVEYLSSPFYLDLNNFKEIRCNFYLQRPEGGGKPCLKDTELENQEGMGWIFNATKLHHSTPVEGNTNRIVMSLGSVIRTDKLKDLTLL